MAVSGSAECWQADSAFGRHGDGVEREHLVSDEQQGEVLVRRRPSRGSWRRFLGTALVLLVVLFVGFGAGFGAATFGLLSGVAPAARATEAAQGTPTPAASPMDVFLQAWGIVQEHYVDRQALSQRDLAYGAIAGLVNALGDTGHSRFLTPDDLKRSTTDLSGKFEGIGAVVSEQDGKLVIASVLDDSPAQKAGMLADDVIVAVNGESVEGLTLSQVTDKIRGPSGSSVRISVIHKGQTAPTELEVVRAEIPVQSVTWTMVPGTKVAYIRVSQFAGNTDDQLIKVLNAARAAGATGIVFDLRSNYGGYLYEGVDVASQFLTSGNVLIERDANDKRKPDAVKAGGVATQIPMVTLVNGGTASAAEIVAGALQEHKRAVLIGDKTFGAGTVLDTFKLSDGSALLLGTSEWLTPDGHRIWKVGITPDVSVTLASGKQPLTPEEVAKMTPSQLKASDDAQLLRALDEVAKAPATAGR